MTPFHEVGLDARRRALVEAALQDDPALAVELELISGVLDEDARGLFWTAFADGCERARRPAAAVLAALEHAAGCT